jgi:hypothetical protein
MKVTELERLERAATPGPWRTLIADDDNGVMRPHIKGGRPEPMGMWVAAFYAYADTGDGGDDNAALVAAARNALPALLAAATALSPLTAPDDSLPPDLPDDAEVLIAVTVGDIRRARAALAALEAL